MSAAWVSSLYHFSSSLEGLALKGCNVARCRRSDSLGAQTSDICCCFWTWEKLRWIATSHHSLVSNITHVTAKQRLTRKVISFYCMWRREPFHPLVPGGFGIALQPPFSACKNAFLLLQAKKSPNSSSFLTFHHNGGLPFIFISGSAYTSISRFF